MKLPFQPQMPLAQARMLSPLQLAFIGDSVHTLLCRTQLLEHDYRPNDLHRHAAHMVNAASQKAALDRLLPRLTEDEVQIVLRGRNAHPRHHVPKGATCAEYQGATALEALYGYLYLTGQTDRLLEIYTFSTQEVD